MRPIVTIPLLFAVSFSAQAQPATSSPGDGFDVVQYSVTLRPDLATTAVSGVETITLQSTSGQLKHVAFTANALRISGATINGKPVEAVSGKDSIAFPLPTPLERGRRITLSFKFEGTPTRGVTAVAGVLYTSYFACDWMVCLQDSPGDKAMLNLDLLLPAGLSSMGVGQLLSTKSMPGGMVQHSWRSTRAYSPYLFAFAAGPFARKSVRAAQGDMIYLDGTGSKADLPQLFAQTPLIAKFFADKAGVALPSHRYVQILVPGNEAQESVSFSLLGKDHLEAERDDPSSAWVIAHEMAHQWWGNLVTCATWQDFWLNEGITTFMVAAWKEHSIGKVAYQQELDNARRRVERVRTLGFEKPLAWGGKYPTLGARRAVQYSKGALFLAHLREVIGEAAFWKGLRNFTQRHAGGIVTSKDFQRAMEESSKRDLSQLFGEWVYGT